jgi:aspartyl-tRNA(Asn)/glutamyl-tRNA(Gln) amidotransferase subunit B
MKYIATIGLESPRTDSHHIQDVLRLSHRRLAGHPNTNVCPVCLGLPGALPVPNRRAIELATMTGLALHSTITRDSAI